MKIEQLFQPFEVVVKRSNECPVERHRHTFFELIYILKGTGKHCINGNNFTYRDENLFLIRPEVPHHFKVEETTSFLLIKFHSIYLNAQKATEDHSDLGDWIRKMEYIFQNSDDQLGCVLRNHADKPLVRMLADTIMHEYVNQSPWHKELIQQLINTMITIVARNISMVRYTDEPVAARLSQQMLVYIQRNIYAPEKLKMDEIAKHFNLSHNYVSEYFRKHIGETLQHYIIKYKLKLAEVRLQFSDMRINEIAYELGFTDESHLNKMFRKYNGLTPTAFRKAKAAVRAAA